MNRYLFWFLMMLPWVAITLHITSNEDAKITTGMFIALFLYLVTVVEFRRRAVGLTIKEVLKAQIFFWGFKERQKLYFSKP
jgi:hypothetical protein